MLIWCYRVLRIRAIRRLFPLAHHAAKHKAAVGIVCAGIGLPLVIFHEFAALPASGFTDERLPVPEPGSALLMILPLVVLFRLWRR